MTRCASSTPRMTRLPPACCWRRTCWATSARRPCALSRPPRWRRSWRRRPDQAAARRTCWQQGRSPLDFLSQLLRGPPAARCPPAWSPARPETPPTWWHATSCCPTWRSASCYWCPAWAPTRRPARPTSTGWGRPGPSPSVDPRAHWRGENLSAQRPTPPWTAWRPDDYFRDYYSAEVQPDERQAIRFQADFLQRAGPLFPT